MEALIAFGKGCGLEVLQLEVRSDNAPAIALYESLGFEKMGPVQKLYEGKRPGLRCLVYELVPVTKEGNPHADVRHHS